MLKLSSGRSEKDRISFFKQNNNGATAIRYPNGEINIKYEKRPTITRKAVIFLLVIFGVTSIAKSFIIVPLIEKKEIEVIWYLLPALIYLIISIFSIIVVRKQGGKELLKNHGAEHMVFTAYKKLKRVPTIEEAKKFSRINKACGITLYSAFITSQIIGFVIYMRTGYLISEIILFLVPIFLNTTFPFNFIGKLAQFFTTQKPEDENIELAIAAVSALEKLEQKKQMLFDSIMTFGN